MNPGCVKAQKLEIFMGRVTLPGPRKNRMVAVLRGRFFCPWTIFTFLHSLGRLRPVVAMSEIHVGNMLCCLDRPNSAKTGRSATNN